MYECLIMGDSIAIGTAMYRPECVVIAEKGITSKSWVNRRGDMEFSAGTVIISLGSNDHKGIDTKKELRKIRLATRAKRVYWILPTNNITTQELVKELALEYNDIVLPITNLSADGIHPTGQGYKELAKRGR